MKVLYILPINWGGMPHYTAELANAVSMHEDVIVLVPKNFDNAYFDRKIKVLNILEPLGFSIGKPISMISFKNFKNILSFRNISIITKLNPDIIHITTPLLPPLLFFIFINKFDNRYPMIITRHGLQSISGSKLVSLMDGFINFTTDFIKFKKIIVHGETDKKILIDRHVSEEAIAVVPHGIYSLFRDNGKNVLAEKNCILFFGRITQYKGLDYLIKAAPIISKHIRPLKIIVAGEGNLSQYLDGMKDRSLFEIVNEYISNDMVSHLFQRAELIVLPYTDMFGQSGVLNIAYAFDKPVVATSVGDIPEIIEDGKTGILVPPKDSNALARSIIRILKDDILKREMSKQIHEKSKELSWSNIAKKHIEIYSQVIIDFKS